MAIEETANFPTPYRYLAACYAHMGEIDKSRQTVARLRAITTSAVMPPIMYLRKPEHRALFLSGLRLAMGEAT